MTITIAPRLADVRVVEETVGGFPMISVHPIWADVDRPDVGGWGLPVTAAGRRNAARLERAIRAGAAFGSVEVRTDNAGQTYVSATHTVLGRRMNADLRRLGF